MWGFTDNSTSSFINSTQDYFKPLTAHLGKYQVQMLSFGNISFQGGFMKKVQLLLGIVSVLSLSACGTLPQPTESATEVNAQVVRPPRPPRPPGTGVNNSASVNCNSDGITTTCEITINNVKQVRSYAGSVSINITNGVVQILRNGQVIDEIRP
jgi:putative hemolysin